MRITLLLLLTFFSITLFSQQDSLLKKFKYRIDHYQAINLSIGGNGNISNTNFPPGKNESKGSSGSIVSSYSLLQSTDRILLNVYASMLSNYGLTNTKTQSEENKYSSLNINSYVDIQNKWFSRKIFAEAGIGIAAGFNNHTATTKNTSQDDETKNKQGQYSFSINAGIGKGRLENVTDMQNALWLYKALQEEHRLSRILSAEELNDLGRTITKANNTRILDNRKRTQFALQTADSFFQSKALIAENDICYFSFLNDILFFAFNNQRLSGTESFIRLTSSLNLDNRDQDGNIAFTDYKGRSMIKSIDLNAGIKKYVPASLKHQNNYGVSIKASYIDWNMTDKYFAPGNPTSIQEINSTLKQAGVTAFLQHAIYPNTRTIISFDLFGEIGYQHLEDEESFFGEVTLSGLLNYFISYRTRLTAGLGTSYRKNTFQSTYDIYLLPEMFYLNANIGLQVSL